MIYGRIPLLHPQLVTLSSTVLTILYTLRQARLRQPGVRRGNENGLEYRTRLVRGYYDSLLQRPADAGEANAWVRALAAGLTTEQIQAWFMASAEYFQTEAMVPTAVSLTPSITMF